MTEGRKLRKTINSSVVDVLEQMKKVSGDDRYHLLMEWMEYLVESQIDSEDILLVPDFTTGVDQGWKFISPPPASSEFIDIE